jgi:hypothetical protein
MGNCMQRHSIFTMVFVRSNGLGRVLALVGHGGELGSELEYILPISRFDFASKARIMSWNMATKVACQYVGLTHGRFSESRRQVEVELEFPHYRAGQSSHLRDPEDDCA